MELSVCLIWTLLIIIAIIFIRGYLFMKTRYEYWEKRNVAHVNPVPLFGNIFKVFTFSKSLNDIYKESYDNFPNEKVVGIYELLKPVLIVRDPKLIEKIFIKDFSHFMNRVNVSEGKSILESVLFQMKDTKWKSVRSKITPAFTSGKLKLMFNYMLECSDKLTFNIQKNLNKDYEIKNDLGEYSLDVIANAILGIEIRDTRERGKLSEMVSSIFKITPIKFLEILTVLNMPKLANLMGLSVIPRDMTEYFHGFIMNTFEKRINNKYHRNDYVQQLLKLKEKGSIEMQANYDEDEYLNLDGKLCAESIEITDELLTGQAFQFIVAGHDFIYLNMLYTMFELARNDAIQDSVRGHVKEVLSRHQQYTYEAVKEMTYLEQCIQETMRLYAPSHVLTRVCSKHYVTEDGLIIEKGQKVIIPLNALHMDPKYYPKPELFNPDRLPPNSIRSNFTYMPFGDGPRICIGTRFSMVEMKLGLAKILENFKFQLTSKTKVPFEMNKLSFIVFPSSVIEFKVTPVEK